MRVWIMARDRSDPLLVRRDPRDLSRVFVLDPLDGGYLEVPTRDLSRRRFRCGSTGRTVCGGSCGGLYSCERRLFAESGKGRCSRPTRIAPRRPRKNAISLKGPRAARNLVRCRLRFRRRGGRLPIRHARCRTMTSPFDLLGASVLNEDGRHAG
jgi:hypothetical protein